MHHNIIEQVDRASLSGGAHLQMLDLSYNAIEVLPSRLMADLVRFRIVDLSSNRLRQLPRDLFDGSPVDTLNVARNHLNAFPVGCLSAISSTLVNLDLSHNQVAISLSLHYRY